MPAADPISFAQAAMLCEGPELYGVGSVLRLYAESRPETLFVCFEDGHMARWLREHKRRVIVLGRRFGMDAQRSSLAFMARVASGVAHTRKSADMLAPMLEKEGIRLVHSHWFEQQVVAGWLRRRGFKSVWHFHNTTNEKRLAGLGLKMNHALARRGADLLMPVSDFIGKNWRASGVPVRVVHNAAAPIFDTTNTLPSAPVRCVIGARLDPKKGVHLAVGAVLAARSAGVDATLDIYGGPVENNPYADALLRTIAAAGATGAIRLMGFRADLREHHQDHHLGLQCRVDPEPCSMWVCETLVDGLPLVAAANGGTPELVLDGETGVLFEPGNAADLAEKLIALARDPDRLAAMRKAAFARGRADFTPERMMRETLEGYGSICPP